MTTMTTSAEKKLYTDNLLKQQGVRTTSINTSGGEATFVDYGGALNDKIKNAILNGGFGEDDGWDAAELAMQEDIANLFRSTGKSCMQTNDLIAILTKAGYKVDSQYMKTSYIVDNKASSNHLGATNGAINILTITDKDGNDIVIADANGNAAIETEELFLNEILTGAVSMIEGVNYSDFNTNGAGNAKANTVNMYLDMPSFDFNDKLEYGLGLNKEEADKLFETNTNKSNEKEDSKKDKDKEKLKIVSKAKYEKIKKERTEKFINEYIKLYGEDDLSEKELQELAEKEAQDYMEKKYKVE